MLCEPLTQMSPTITPHTQLRRGSLFWRAELEKNKQSSEPVKRVCFSFNYHVQEFDPEEAPHACNPSPFLELSESVDDESGVTVQRFLFEFEACEQPGTSAEFHFETCNPEWSGHGNGVRSRLLCIRYARCVRVKRFVWPLSSSVFARLLKPPHYNVSSLTNMLA
jgi:hypothetical protein